MNDTDILKMSRMSKDQEDIRTASEMDKLKVTLSRRGLKVRGDTPSDGDCFFWVASDQLDRVGASHHTHQDLRRMTMRHIECLSEVRSTDFSSRVGKNYLISTCTCIYENINSILTFFSD